MLLLHALFILWVIFGALLTRGRPILHILSLIWGIFTELPPWPCPLTVLEDWLEQKAGVEPYQGGFLLLYMDKLVYPDISTTALTVVGVIVYCFNLALYASRAWGLIALKKARFDASANRKSSLPFRMEIGKTLAIEADGLKIRQNTGLLLTIPSLEIERSCLLNPLHEKGYDEPMSGKQVDHSLWNQPISPARNRFLREPRNEA